MKDTKGSDARTAVPLVATAAAVVAALCCIGVSAVTALAAAGGAAFLLRDATLRPLLLGVLVVTVVAGGLSWRRHRKALPVLVSAVAAGALYASIFGPWASRAHEDHMHDAMQSSAHHAVDAGNPFVWVSIAFLIGAQVWGVVAAKRSARGTAPEVSG